MLAVRYRSRTCTSHDTHHVVDCDPCMLNSKFWTHLTDPILQPDHFKRGIKGHIFVYLYLSLASGLWCLYLPPPLCLQNIFSDMKYKRQENDNFKVRKAKVQANNLTSILSFEDNLRSGLCLLLCWAP